MPIIKSAKKRVRLTRKATIRNAKTKRALKTAIKTFQASVNGKNASEELRKAQSALDKAAKKNVMHKNKVARKQRQLAKAAKAAGVKVGKKVATAAKPVVKAAAKKAPAKKAAPKKTVAKKPAAKKATPKKK